MMRETKKIVSLGKMTAADWEIMFYPRSVFDEVFLRMAMAIQKKGKFRIFGNLNPNPLEKIISFHKANKNNQEIVNEN